MTVEEHVSWTEKALGPRCRECGGQLHLDFINKRNIGSNSLVLVCHLGHNNFVEGPIGKMRNSLRLAKAMTVENRAGSLRNVVFSIFGLCQCSNTVHGHREGIHARGHKVGRGHGSERGHFLCNKCDGAFHPEWYTEGPSA